MKLNLFRCTSILMSIYLTIVCRFSYSQSRDSGGASSYYKGEPLESSLKDPRTEFPAYQQIIKPILEKMGAENSNPSSYGLKNIFEFILAKPWYFLEGPFEPLPKGTVGAPIETQEGVLQNYQDVWVDKKLLNGPEMDIKKEAIVLMHELLIGIKILRFESSMFNFFKILRPFK